MFNGIWNKGYHYNTEGVLEKQGTRMATDKIHIRTDNITVSFAANTELAICVLKWKDTQLIYRSIGTIINGEYSKEINVSDADEIAFFILNNDNPDYKFTETDVVDFQIETERETDYIKPVTQKMQIREESIYGLPVGSGGNYTDENGQQWYADEIDLAQGIYIKRIGYYTISENSTIAIESNAIHENSVCIALIDVTDATNDVMSKNAGIICTHAKKVLGVYNIDSVGCGYTGGAHFLRLRVPLEAGPTINEIKKYLIDKQIEILYTLENPVEIQLDDEEIEEFRQLKTCKGITCLLNDKNAYMSVEYVADPKTYIDNKFNELSNAIIASTSEEE